MRTLVLDQSYQPHRVVSWQRAICMLFQGKANVVYEYDEEIRTPRKPYKMPAVIVLMRKKVWRKSSLKFSRLNVATRDGFCCQYCGVKFPLRDLTKDHVVPRAQGGRTTWDNIVMACRHCNERKGNQTPEQAGMRLLKKPVKPKELPVMPHEVDPEADLPEQWMPFYRKRAS